VLSVVLALVPVLLFLSALVLLDSFKLVRPAAVAAAVAFGAAAALACAWLHETLIPLAGVGPSMFGRYIAPLTEESAKALFIVFLVRRRRVGFLVDAAVQGFAVGCGFGLIENVMYLRALPHAPALLWVVRGLGTAVLHGAATAILAMMARTAADRQPDRWARVFLPGWVAAVAIHSIFNHFVLQPLTLTLLLLAVLPVLTLFVFSYSEGATREWVTEGMDLDLELLGLVLSEHFTATRLGTYLQELRTRFPGPVVADMYCLLRLELELAVQARALLMAREAGLVLPPDDDLRKSLEEIECIRHSIGTTGLLALRPLNVTTHRDRWHKHLLGQLR
jgi:protease PrsW